jgi:hypothetical protein
MGARLTNAIFWIGTVFCLAGIFLPWEYSGGFLNFPIHGIQLSPRLVDHGGFGLLTLIGFHILATLRSPQPPEKAGLGYLLSAVLLVLSALYFTGRWFLHHLLWNGTVEAPALGIELALILPSPVRLVTIVMTKI